MEVLVDHFDFVALYFLPGSGSKNQFEKELFPGVLRSEAAWMEGKLTITQVLKSKETSISLQCVINTLETKKDSSSTYFTDRYLLLQIRNPAHRNLLPGDQINFKGYVSPIAPPFNPYAFDARTYSKRLAYGTRLFAKARKLKLLFPGNFQLID
jgi:hypothetical protein